MSSIEVTREGSGSHRAGHVWMLRVDGVAQGTFETKRQALDFAESLLRASKEN